MSAMQGAISAAERSMRSVFVGNIPYEATEEQLKDIFSEVGPVVSFRLVYDRETGKPKGYGFCEYKDQEMALSAMRNLNGYELNGRALRVDNAASEKSKEELKNLQASLGGPPVESPYGPEVDPEKAPEEISKAVASLPPEQMFELMKQMKMCIQNNPNEARNLLLQNPQLAYALLQAQVVMRIVDPQVAMSILHRPAPPIAQQHAPSEADPMINQLQQPGKLPLSFAYFNPAAAGSAGVYGAMPVNEMGSLPAMPPTGIHTTASMSMPLQSNPGVVNQRIPVPMVRPSLLGERPPVMDPTRLAGPVGQFPTDRGMEMMESYPSDPRAMVGDRDLRGAPDRMPQIGGEKDVRQAALADQDMRHLPNPTPASDGRPFDPRFRALQGVDPAARGATTGFDRQRPPFDPRTAYESRGPQTTVADPRNGPQVRPSMQSGNLPVVSQSVPGTGPPARPPASVAAAAALVAPHDQEKAQLIMQVLQLSDQQIALLPPEQRQSIMILKEQIARSGQGQQQQGH